MANPQNTVSVNIQVDTGTSSAAVQQLVQQIGALSGAIAKASGTIRVQTQTVNQNSNALRGNAGAANGARNSVTDLTRGVFQGNLAFFTLRGTLVQVQRGFSLFSDAVRNAINAASEQQAAMAQLDQILRNTGETMSGLREQVVELSTNYQALTGIGDDVIQSFQTQLIAFGATSENIERLTKVTLDLSAGLGKDLNASALLVGKALQGQFSTLSRFGISVDEGASKAHKLEQALAAIEKRFGGSALAQAQNYTGQMKVLNALTADLSETFGAAVVENANFFNALRAGNQVIAEFTGVIAGMYPQLSNVANVTLEMAANALPALVRGFLNFLDIVLDTASVVLALLDGLNQLVAFLGGLRRTVELVVSVMILWKSSVLALALANAELAISIGVIDTAIKKTPWGAIAGLVLQLAVVALSASGALDKLAGYFIETVDSGTGAQEVVAAMKVALQDLKGPLGDAAQGFKDLTQESLSLNRNFSGAIEELKKAQTELSNLQLNQPADKSLIRPSQLSAIDELLQRIDGLRAGLFLLANQAFLTGNALDKSFLDAAARAGVIIDVGQVGPPAPGGRVEPGKDKPKGNDALDSLKEEIEATRLEIKIRQEGIDQARLVAETDALVAAGKKGISAKSAELAAVLAKEKVALIELQRVEADLKKVQDLLYETPRDIQMINAKIAAVTALNQNTVKAVDIKKAEAVAEAKVYLERAKTVPLMERLKILVDAETKAIQENTQAEIASAQAANADTNETLELRQKEYDLLLLVRDGKISLEEADIRLARAQAEANNQAGANVEMLARQELAIEKLRKKIEDTQIDLGKSVDNIIDGLVDGILEGTNKGLNAMEIFKRSGQALFGDMLKGMLKDKLNFDQKFSANFLKDLPSIVAGGAQAIGGIWNSLMGSLSGTPGAASSGWGSVASGLGSAAGALLGGGGVGGGGVLLGAAQLAASGGNIGIGNAGSILTVLKGLYSGFQAWSAGGSFGSVLNAGLGGFVEPLVSAIGTVAPNLASGISSLLGGFGGTNAAAVAAANAVPFTGVAGGAGFSGGAALGASSFAPAAPAVSSLATIISVAAPYLAMLGGIIATNTGVASLLNSDMYDRAFTLKDRRRVANGGPIDDFVQNAIAQATTLGVVQKGATQLEAAQKTFRGEGSAGDIAQTVLQVFTNLPQLIVAAFGASLPTGGTATRAAFEDWIEDARKHQSRAFNPFFGSVPVIDPATRKFVVASGEYDRNLGQDLVRDRLTQKYGSDKDTPEGAFVETMRELIYEEGRALGLTDELTKGFIGLSVAFKAITLGSKGGSEIQRYLANALELVANLREAGASTGLAIQFLRFEVARLGDPKNVFNDINEELEKGKIDAQTYREAIEGLAQVYFKFNAEGKLEFDLSDKTNKGLKVAQETLDAIKDIIKDVPPGVHVATIAVDLLNKAFVDGKQGVVTFQELEKAINRATESANMLNPEVLNFFNIISKGATEAIKLGAEDALIDGAIENFVQTLGRQIQEMVSQSIVEGFLYAQINTGILAPLAERTDAAKETYLNSDRTQADLDVYVAEIQAAGLDAIQMIKDMGPALREMAQIALQIGQAFDQALLAETADDAVGLAQALDALREAQKAFNVEIDARIFALRNQGKKDPDALREGLPDIAKEFQLEMLVFFGSVTDAIAAVNSGLIENSQLQMVLSEQSQATDEERLAALGRMRALAEADLAIRIEAIQIRAANEIEAHNENIENLQEQREQIQENFEAAIEARQTELDLIQQQIDLAEKWQGAVDSLKDTIFSLQTGQDSPLSPTARLSVAEEQFSMFERQFRDESLSDDERVKAANKLAELGPQLVQLIQAVGYSQSSESYARIFDIVVGALEDARIYSQGKVDEATGGKTVEELQAEANRIQEEIKDLQKDQKAQLKAIDDTIKREQDAIKAIQERVQRDIDKVSNNTAGVLEWIKGKGNEIFERQTEKLKEELKDLGVDSANLYGVQTDSWLTLLRIEQILKEQGIDTTYDPKPPNGGNESLPPSRIEGAPTRRGSPISPTDLSAPETPIRRASSASTDNGSITIQQLTVTQNPEVKIEAETAFKLTEEGIREARPMMRALFLQLLEDSEIKLAVVNATKKNQQNQVRRV